MSDRLRSHLMDGGVSGLVSKWLSTLLERALTKKRESVQIDEILLRENVSADEMHRRLEELLKHER